LPAVRRFREYSLIGIHSSMSSCMILCQLAATCGMGVSLLDLGANEGFLLQRQKQAKGAQLT
jgi:hypothetical protein